MRATDEAVEKAAQAMSEANGGNWDDLTPCVHDIWLAEARAALTAALPVIERDLRETIASHIERHRKVASIFEDPNDFAAARVREAGSDDA